MIDVAQMKSQMIGWRWMVLAGTGISPSCRVVPLGIACISRQDDMDKMDMMYFEQRVRRQHEVVCSCVMSDVCACQNKFNTFSLISRLGCDCLPKVVHLQICLMK